MGFWRVVGAFGRLLVVLGVIVLLFVVYLLWGTGISESSHQHALRTEFGQALRQDHRSPSTAPTTAASSLVRELASGNAPANGQPIAIIDIPRIGLDKVVVQGTSTDDLHLGPGHYDGTPLPGQPGNVGIAGHRTTFGAPFYNLNELSPGDPVILTTLQGTFTYSVVSSQVVSPSDTSVLEQTPTPMLTLTTCNPRFSASERLIVEARLSTTPVPAPSSPAPTPQTGSSGELAGSQGPWAGALEWGIATLALAIAIWMVPRRRPRLMRWSAYAVGILPVLVLLYFFFENLSPLLPASY